MKRITFALAVLIILISSLPSLAAHAQSGRELIVLNDTTPGIDVVVNPNPDTTGVVALEINDASITVTDAVGNIVFQAADPGIKGVEFSFAPNAGTHTLTIERLPGAVQAHARITSLPEMTPVTTTPQLVNASTLTVNQEADFPLDATSPSSVVNFVVPGGDYATVTAQFPGAPVTTQLVDLADNRTLATLSGSLIDGVRFKVDDGTYQLLVLNNNTAQQTVANVKVLPAPQSDFDALVAQVDTANTTTLTTTGGSSGSSAAVAPTCIFTVNVGSANLRSGPGTGYSVLDYAFRGEALVVGGVSSQSNWLLVGTDTGSGWIAGSLGTLSGGCDNLTPYDIPYREAVTPQVTIQQAQVPVYYGDDGYGEHDDDHGEREGHEEHDD